MKLINCYISSFGKIKDFNYDFSEGLNTILEENGWGKTTFTVTGLENGRIYYFAISAFPLDNPELQGELSKEVFARPSSRL